MAAASESRAADTRSALQRARAEARTTGGEEGLKRVRTLQALVREEAAALDTAVETLEQECATAAQALGLGAGSVAGLARLDESHANRVAGLDAAATAAVAGCPDLFLGATLKEELEVSCKCGIQK